MLTPSTTTWAVAAVVAPKINRKAKSNFFIGLVLMIYRLNPFSTGLIDPGNKYRIFLTKFRRAADVYPAVPHVAVFIPI
jgi:hypothetical protein